MKITKVAVIGAGNMGSGIAQKIATEGVSVVLVDATAERAEAGKQRIATLLGEAVERRLFRPEQVEGILARVTPTGEIGDVAEVDLVIEAIFEDLNVKRKLFEDLSAVCRPDAILATNTSSFLVADVASAASRRRTGWWRLSAIRGRVRAPFGLRGRFRRRWARPPSPAWTLRALWLTDSSCRGSTRRFDCTKRG